MLYKQFLNTYLIVRLQYSNQYSGYLEKFYRCSLKRTSTPYQYFELRVEFAGNAKNIYLKKIL